MRLAPSFDIRIPLADALRPLYYGTHSAKKCRMKKTLGVIAFMREHSGELPCTYARRNSEQLETRTQPTLKTDSLWRLCSDELRSTRR